jgi:ABC-type branched-subunit amino acid transport system substrate-binding protein
MNGSRTRVVGLVAVVAGSLVGLLSIGTSAGAQGSVRGVTDEEITVGGVATAAFFGNNPAKAAQARFDAANKKHEIPGGRTIKFLGVSDDKNTTDVSLSEVRRLVEQQGAFAVVPALAPSFQAGATYLEQQKVPMIGWGVAPGFCQDGNRYAFGFNGCLIQYGDYSSNVPGPAVARYFQHQGKNPKTLAAAVIGENFDASKAGTQSVANGMRLAGFNVVYAETPIPGAPSVVTDFSPYVQALMTANKGQPPDVIYYANAGANLFGMIRSMNQAGYKGAQVHSTYSPQVTGPAAGTMALNTFATAEQTVPGWTRSARR